MTGGLIHVFSTVYISTSTPWAPRRNLHEVFIFVLTISIKPSYLFIAKSRWRSSCACMASRPYRVEGGCMQIMFGDNCFLCRLRSEIRSWNMWLKSCESWDFQHNPHHIKDILVQFFHHQLFNLAWPLLSTFFAITSHTGHAAHWMTLDSESKWLREHGVNETRQVAGASMPEPCLNTFPYIKRTERANPPWSLYGEMKGGTIKDVSEDSPWLNSTRS